MGDLRENSEYKAALERQQLVQARWVSSAAPEQAVEHDISQIPSTR